MTDDLKTLPAGEWLGDVDMRAWFDLMTCRGGCRCHLSAPCRACTDPPAEDELNAVGFTYEATGQEGGA